MPASAGAFVVPAAADRPRRPHGPGSPAVDGYGPLRKAGKELALPKGFSYTTFGRVGTTMSDGLPTPGAHDGIGIFRAGEGRVRLIRNHEVDLDIPGTKQKAISPVRRVRPAAPAGCTSSLYDIDERRLVESFLVLNGTLSNCSGRHDAVGLLAELRGDDRRRQGRLREAARLRLRDPGEDDRHRRAGAAEGDGPVRARDRAGRPEDRHRLHDRGQRRPRRRVLPLRAEAEGPPGGRRHPADARDHRREALQHGQGPAGRRGPRRRTG